MRAGWILSELLAIAGAITEGTEPPAAERGSGTSDVLPSRLSEPTTPAALALQLHAKVSQLKPDLDLACVDDTCWRSIKACLDQLVLSPGDLGTARLVRTGEAISRGLTAASTRLARAFDLGFDLATTCRLADQATLPDLEEVLGGRATAVQQALADLSSVLPDHAGRAVSLSLAVWQHWAANPQLSRRPVKWPNASVGRALQRQGEVWEAVLSGEKLGKDMLGVSDYARALWALVRGVFSRWWVWMIVVATVAAASGGIYLLIAHGSTAKKIEGAVLTGLGAAGLRVASLKRMLGNLADELEREVWGAELDRAIGDAITVPPGDWRLTVGSRAVEMPPPRGVDPHYAQRARTIHVLSRRSRGELHEPYSTRRATTALYLGWRSLYGHSLSRVTWFRARRVRGFLEDGCQYEVEGEPGAEPLVRKTGVSRELVRLALDDYVELACAPSGRLAARHGDDGPSVVWTFHRDKVRHIVLCKNYDTACSEAAKPWMAGLPAGPAVTIEASAADNHAPRDPHGTR